MNSTLNNRTIDVLLKVEEILNVELYNSCNLKCVRDMTMTLFIRRHGLHY